MHAQQGGLGGSALGYRPMPTSSTGSGWLELKVCVLVSLVLFITILPDKSRLLSMCLVLHACMIMRKHRWQAKQAYPPGSVCGSNWSMISGASKSLLSCFHVRISTCAITACNYLYTWCLIQKRVFVYSLLHTHVTKLSAERITSARSTHPSCSSLSPDDEVDCPKPRPSDPKPKSGIPTIIKGLCDPKHH